MFGGIGLGTRNNQLAVETDLYSDPDPFLLRYIAIRYVK